MRTGEFCAVCGFRSDEGLIPIMVEGHVFHLCPGHARELELRPPKTLMELQRSFGRVALERRSGYDRRRSARRAPAPPAEERRGVTRGRRATDGA